MTKLAGLVFTLAAITSSIEAHSLFTTLHVNGVDQGDATCVRMPKNSRTATNPVTNFDDNAMVCGFDGTVGVKRSSGEGNGWFKIWEDGYDAQAGKWCSDKVIDNNGIINVNIPEDLAGGNYLVRTELLALHEADKSPPDPQFYIGCAQIYLQSTASSVPTPDLMVSIPGHVKKTDPSALFNIYTPQWPYPMSGPQVYQKGVPSDTSSAASYFHGGLLPPKTVAVNGNWWGTEQESYSTESGCWGATTNCYNQLQTCFDTAPATGYQGCKAYERKCTKMQSSCMEGNFNGPPDQGQVLTKGVNGYIDENAPPMSPVNEDQAAQSRFRKIRRNNISHAL
ncbi:hypothetical protein K3495_g6567 [Podosphaera aphanis]|nr:hypothetical protein K3495_g6567 [Podosphaera aphanis]